MYAIMVSKSAMIYILGITSELLLSISTVKYSLTLILYGQYKKARIIYRFTEFNFFVLEWNSEVTKYKKVQHSLGVVEYGLLKPRGLR